MRKLPFLTGLLLSLSLALPALAVVSFLDRGLLSGSADGRVWSRVVDEAGNTDGQAEVWHLGLPPEGAKLRLTVDTPIPGLLIVNLPFKSIDGYEGEYRMGDQHVTPTGYTALWGPFSPATNPDLSVSVFPDDISMDQVYRISAAWEGGSALAPDPVADAALSGRWNRIENGAVAESIEIIGDGPAVEVVYYNADGSERARLPGSRVGGTILTRSDSRLVVIVVRAGALDYTSTDLDGSNRWDATFTP